MTSWAIVVAAGSGVRFGGAKQLAQLAGRPLYEHALEVAAKACDGVVLVVAEEHHADIVAACAAGAWHPTVVTGGATRSASVRRGLGAVPDEASTVLVHDAARPLATPELFARVIAEVERGADVVVPAVPVVDTIREVDGGTIDRDRLVAVQTPQGFRAAALRSAHAAEAEASDDASLVEAAGGRVVLVPGEPVNRKITTPVDLVIAEALLQGRA